MYNKKIIVIWSLALMPLFSHLKNKFFLAWAPWLGPHLLCRPLCTGKLQAALCKYAADWCLLPACRISAPVISGVACPCSPTVFKLYCSVFIWRYTIVDPHDQTNFLFCVTVAAWPYFLLRLIFVHLIESQM